MYEVVLAAPAEEQYLYLPKADKDRVLAALRDLEERPQKGKKLQDELQGLLSLRIWPYRIVYTVKEKTVTILTIAMARKKMEEKNQN